MNETRCSLIIIWLSEELSQKINTIQQLKIGTQITRIKLILHWFIFLPSFQVKKIRADQSKLYDLCADFKRFIKLKVDIRTVTNMFDGRKTISGIR